MSGRRLVLVGAAGLALFSALYSLAAWYDWWPRLPPGALHDTDLWAGFAGGVALLLALLFHGKNGSRDEGSQQRAAGEGLAPPAPAS